MKYILSIILLLTISTTECMHHYFMDELTRYEEALDEGWLDRTYTEERLKVLEEMSEYGIYMLSAGLIVSEVVCPFAKDELLPMVKSTFKYIIKPIIAAGGEIACAGINRFAPPGF